MKGTSCKPRIIFDLHGVLVFEFPAKEYLKAVKEVLPEFEELKKLYGTGAMVFTKIGRKEDYLKILDSIPTYANKELKIASMLKKLKRRFKLFIVTDNSRKNCLETLENAGIPESMFERIICLDDVNLPKPSVEPYKKVINPNVINIVIGDRKTDLIPALELGCVCIQVKSRREVLKWLEVLHECSKVFGKG